MRKKGGALGWDVANQGVGNDDAASAKQVASAFDASDFEVIVVNYSTDRSQSQTLELMTRPNFSFRFPSRRIREWAVAQLHLGQTDETMMKVLPSVDKPVLHARYEQHDEAVVNDESI